LGKRPFEREKVKIKIGCMGRWGPALGMTKGKRRLLVNQPGKRGHSSKGGIPKEQREAQRGFFQSS